MALWLGCGGGGADITGPPVGTLDVTTSTSGPEPDADGYAVSIDGAAPAAIGSTATRRTEGLAVGPHTVELSGIAANCAVSEGTSLTVDVRATSVASASFAVACTPTTGTIEVTTTSTGTPADTDGYRLLLDGAESLPIGTSATVAISTVAPGAHAVGLDGLAANCAVDGDNPREVTVTAAATSAVTIAVSCTPPVPPPGAGAISVTTRTTGPDQDADGYAVTLDGGAGLPIGADATLPIPDLAPGAHTVGLTGISANCRLDGANPRSVTVASGGTAQVTFAVACTATTGGLTLTVAGLPDGVSAAVTVTGPRDFTQQVTGTRTLTELAPGSYTVTAAEVTSGGTKYTASPASRSVAVAAAATADVTITYAPAAGPALNLRIDGLYLTQSVQSPAGGVPLVNDRDGFLRVFAVASETNTAAPSVRVRLYRDGALTATLTIPAPSASTPTSRSDGNLARSWNVKIPRGLIGPGLAILADVDPDNAIPEKDEADNGFPASGTPQPQTVRGAPLFGVRFVPVKQLSSGLQGDVSSATTNDYLSLLRRIYPLARTDGDVHAVYTTTTSDPLQPDDANGAWVTILSELDALRVAEGTARHYYGVVRVGYQSGLAGLGYLGWPTAMGYDQAFDRGRVMAHELGHNWDRRHSPCGQPSGIDPDYPFPDGRTGVYGFDLQADVLKDPSLPDIMGYCGDPWISEYTYEAVLAYRAGAQAALAAAASAREQRCLLVWGRIVDGRPVLEPAFEIVTRPSLPTAGGPYTVEGLSADGARLFGLSFDAAVVADDRRGSRHFAFAVPLGDEAAARLGGIRVGAPGGEAAAVRTAAPLGAARAADVVEARAVAGGVALRWNAAAHPMVMVRDPATGEVLSFARGGEAEVGTDRRELDVIVSDRVGSRQIRVTAGR